MKISKPFILFILLNLWACVGFGQSQKSFDQLITTTNQHLEKYAGQSPFGSDQFISLKNTGLPKEKIKYINEHFGEDDGYSKDSISEFNLLLEFQDLIIENITDIISHDKFEHNQIEASLNQDMDLSIVVSDDRKLFNFSLDEKTGGTYRSRISITHYTQDGTAPALQNKNDTELKYQHGVFEGDGFNGIYSLKTDAGIKYVLTSSVRGCSYCFESNIMLVSLQNGVFEKDFSYSVNSRMWDEAINYNPVDKTITVDYITYDLTTDCGCSNNIELDQDEAYNYIDHEIELIIKKCHCIFEFNGLDFELVKESWEKIKE